MGKINYPAASNYAFQQEIKKPPFIQGKNIRPFFLEDEDNDRRLNLRRANPPEGFDGPLTRKMKKRYRRKG